MYISRNWLKEFVPIPEDLSAKDFDLKLTLHSVESEGFESEAVKFDHMVVGKVVAERAHPDADKLKLYDVDLGEETKQIVCGGSNVTVDMFVLVAKPGARVRWHGEGELITLEETKVRGELSYGMICAASEVGLSELFPDEGPKEIIDLSAIENLQPGMSISAALGYDDVIYEVDNKTLTHRPDLWGHYGMARDVAAFLELPLQTYAPPAIESSNERELSVTVDDSALCLRFNAVIIDHIAVRQSPWWLQKRLVSIGLRPINALVDITNYVMYELGLPMHAYDFDKVGSESLVIRRAQAGEKLQTLDGKERTLQDDVIVVANDNKPLAMAGIMGGEETEVSQHTTRIILEAGIFEPVLTRRASVKYGCRTDASLRQEKNLDPELLPLAMQRAVELILQIHPGARVVSNVADVYNTKYEIDPIAVSVDWLSQRAGVEFKPDYVVSVLERLGFGVENNKGDLKISVPSWRRTKDISIKEDILEEVSRIYGYDAITMQLPAASINPPDENLERKLERKIKTMLAGLGVTETHNHTFVSAEQLQKLALPIDKHIALKNPVSEEHALVRMNLLPNLVNNVLDNYNQQDKVVMGEFGRVFSADETKEAADPENTWQLPKQDKNLGIVYYDANDDQPFMALKGIVESLFAGLHITISFAKPDIIPDWAHPERFAVIKHNCYVLGMIGELHPFVLQDFGMKKRIAVMECEGSGLVTLLNANHSFVDITKYPAVNYDVAILVDKNQTWQSIQDVVIKTSDGLARNVALFDVYEGEHIPDGKKSLAFHVLYQSTDKTLTSDEVQPIHTKVVAALEKELGAELRK